MAQNVDKLLKAKAELRLAEYLEFRENLDESRLALVLPALKNRIEQDLSVAVAAYEIDSIIENESFRVHRNPADGLADVMALVARLDAINELIAKYQPIVDKMYEEQWAAQVTDEGTELPEGIEECFVDLEAEGTDEVAEPAEEASGDE